MRSNAIRLGVIGAGNMGEAILRGYLTSGYASGDKTSVYDPDTEKCRALERDLGVTVADSLASLIEKSDLLLIAVMFVRDSIDFARRATIILANNSL